MRQELSSFYTNVFYSSYTAAIYKAYIWTHYNFVSFTITFTRCYKKSHKTKYSLYYDGKRIGTAYLLALFL